MDREQTVEYRKKRLQDFIDLKYARSKAALGRALGYRDGAFVGQMLRGERPITEKTIDQIHALPGGKAWFAGADKSNISPGPVIRGSVPLLSSVQAGAFREVLDSHSGDDGMMDQIPTTVPVNRYTFALRVQGDSMEPKFTEGMLLIVEPEMDAQHNDYVIVKNGSEETTFKRLVRDGEDWFLKPLNERYPIKPLGNNTIVGVVRGVTEQFR